MVGYYNTVRLSRPEFPRTSGNYSEALAAFEANQQRFLWAQGSRRMSK